MLVVEVKQNESIEKALKRFRQKFQKARIMQEVRRRKEYIKPSVRRRNEILKAIYREKKKRELEG
ncbi:MAG: 30S ribosomal protein S21 [Bacteroidetes bacterium]|nr:MAG: 30S ribosomal protein S21 [Bacteroidota bacterium]